MKIQKTEFLMYRRGTVTAKVRFDEDKIWISDKDLSTEEWPEFQIFQEDLGGSSHAPKYNIDLKKAWEINNTFEGLRKEDGETLNLGNYAFERYIEVEGIVQGESLSGTIWADVGGQESWLTDLIIHKDSIVGFISFGEWETNYLILPGMEELTPFKKWNDGSISAGGRGSKMIGTYMVPMRDGVKLATDVYLPADYKEGEKLPTVMLRTCYNKNDFCKYDAFFTDRGYAVVGQDVRGRCASEGTFFSGYAERNDGSDTLDWIAEQSWSDGNVGTIGGSYEGYNQWLHACSGNPHLKAMIPLSSAGSPFVDVDRRSGAYPMMILPWYVAMSGNEPDFSVYETVNWSEVYKIRPLKDIVKRYRGEDNSGWGELFEHPNYDDFWKETTFSDPMHRENIQVPTLVMVGLYDADLPGSFEGWELLKANGVENRKIIMGPWNHFCNQSRGIAEYKFGANAVRYDFEYLMYQWFDRYLKGIKNEVDGVRAEYYCAIDNQWHESTEWPPIEADVKKLYLKGVNKSLSDTLKGGELSEYLEQAVAFDSYSYDPQDPTPYHFDPATVEGNNPENYADIEKRSDVLIYTSQPFGEDLRLTGTPKAVIFADSSAKDTDWVVRLTRVTEDGKSYRITDDLKRGRYRTGFEKQVLLTPGTIEKYEFDLFYVSQLIKKGECIRLEVASAMNGIIFPNTNTGNPVETDMAFEIAQQKIYCGGQYASSVELPFMRAGEDNDGIGKRK